MLVKHLTQALPEKRLATLLALEKFDEAEELARKFNLDAEVCAVINKIRLHPFLDLQIHLSCDTEGILTHLVSSYTALGHS